MESQETPQQTISLVAKLLSNKLSKCYFNAFKKHWNNTGEICLNIILKTWDMFLHTGLTDFRMFFMTRSITYFSSNVFVIFRLIFFLIIFWRWKELRSKLATMLKMHCYRCFSRNLVKIYRTAILTNFFLCMRSKSQWSTYQVVFFNPLMLVVTKQHTYLNKPGSFSWRFV